eukprot:3050646-Rhodomonas_salina.1
MLYTAMSVPDAAYSYVSTRCCIRLCEYQMLHTVLSVPGCCIRLCQYRILCTAMSVPEIADREKGRGGGERSQQKL